MLITVVEWDSMGHVITEPPSLQFPLKPSKAQPSVSKAQRRLSKARPHYLKQILGRVFWSTDISRILIDSSVKSSFIRLTTAWNSLQSFKYLPSILKFSIQFKSLSLFSSFFSLSDIGFSIKIWVFYIGKWCSKLESN